jgi:hypothetical protein
MGTPRLIDRLVFPSIDGTKVKIQYKDGTEQEVHNIKEILQAFIQRESTHESDTSNEETQLICTQITKLTKGLIQNASSS